MIGALRTWLLSIIAAGLVLSILYALLPKGRLRPIVRTAGGVVLMLVILRPLTELDLEGFAVSYDDYAREIRELTEQYRAADTAELAAIIERETAAYISDKGAALGVNCHAVVETELRSGVPYPCAVTLDVERNETLAACIAADLGIGKEAQVWHMKLEKWTGLLKKYRYAALIVLAGMVLMLLPTGGSKADSGGDSSEAAESFSLEETEKRMAEVLGTINGVGRVRIMLTLRSGSTLRLAEDSTISDSTGGQTKQEKQVLTVNRGSGRQEVVVTQQLYPTYQGAVVVCEGAGSSTVRLAVVNAVSVLTGLSSDKISVVKWKS